MVTREELELAAFWSQRICLDCGDTQEDEEGGEAEEALELVYPCEACSVGVSRKASVVLSILDKVENDGAEFG